VDGDKIRTEIDDNDVLEALNEKDATVFRNKLLPPLQEQAERNRQERKNNKKTIPAGQRVKADDYPGEPAYAHPGIHLRFNGEDEIVWFSDDKINFVVDFGIDPELYLADEDLRPNMPLTEKELQDQRNNPFQDPAKFPLLCVNGEPIRSGPLRRMPDGTPDPRVKAQRFYKFSVTVLGAPITLDPHVECHDGD
jgi:hypothetical protein